MEFNDLLSALGEKIGIDLKADEEGTVNLAVDNMSVVLQAVPELDKLLLYGEVGDPPPEGADRLAEAMLQSNYLFQGTGGATLSQDADSGSYFLCQYEVLSLLDSEKFEKLLESFVNTLESWRRLVADYGPVAAEQAQARIEESNEVSSMQSSGFLQV